jgi:hypothetical protein
MALSTLTAEGTHEALETAEDTGSFGLGWCGGGATGQEIVQFVTHRLVI